MTNLLLNTDSYKASHWKQYPPGTEYVYAYIESRGGEFDRTLFFGLQMWIQEYLTKPITQADIDEAAELFALHGEPFNRDGWEYILDNHKGLMPVDIRAVKEGSVVSNHNVLATIVNTDPLCYWLPSYLETQILRAIWYPSTVATISWHCKKILLEAFKKSSDNPEQIAFKLHDFGSRGVSSHESAGLGGVAHLVNFMGTDTVAAIINARKYYDMPMAGFSIPAAEHSTITAWGKEHESDAYANMLNQFGGKGKMVAVVSDSYNLWNAIENIWGSELIDQVLKNGATLVVRPDSGNPELVPVQAITLLGEKFGYTVNSKGYKVLNPAVRVIQGDGITVNSLPFIIENLLERKWSIDNIAFGMGGGLLQQVNRDTLKFAMKTSEVTIDGKVIEVCKDSVTDPGKASKKGRFALIKNEDGSWKTINEQSVKGDNLLEPVYSIGWQRKQSLLDIRIKAASYLT
jgi:nicotinamide phosphoribosyltransferase